MVTIDCRLSSLVTPYIQLLDQSNFRFILKSLRDCHFSGLSKWFDDMLSLSCFVEIRYVQLVLFGGLLDVVAICQIAEDQHEQFT